MNKSMIQERIERAHCKAAYDLIFHMEEFRVENPDRKHSREYYCKCFQEEALKNSTGEKEYDDNLLGELLPLVIREFSSPRLDENVDSAILRYKRKATNKKILYQSAKAILDSKFSPEKTCKFEIYAYSEDEICISRTTRRKYYNAKMGLTTLIDRVQEAKRMEDLFV